MPYLTVRTPRRWEEAEAAPGARRPRVHTLRAPSLLYPCRSPRESGLRARPAGEVSAIVCADSCVACLPSAHSRAQRSVVIYFLRRTVPLAPEDPRLWRGADDGAGGPVSPQLEHGAELRVLSPATLARGVDVGGSPHPMPRRRAASLPALPTHVPPAGTVHPDPSVQVTALAERIISPLLGVEVRSVHRSPWPSGCAGHCHRSSPGLVCRPLGGALPFPTRSLQTSASAHTT